MGADHIDLIAMGILFAASGGAILLLFLRGRVPHGLRGQSVDPWRDDPSKEEGAQYQGSISTLLDRLKSYSDADEDEIKDGESGFYSEIEARLEQLFVQLDRGRISLVTYRHLVVCEQEEVLRRQAAHNTKMNGFEVVTSADLHARNEIDDALSAIEWCLGWADRMQASLDQSERRGNDDSE